VNEQSPQARPGTAGAHGTPAGGPGTAGARGSAAGGPGTAGAHEAEADGPGTASKAGQPGRLKRALLSISTSHKMNKQFEAFFAW
jgi:hypothetical protein